IDSRLFLFGSRHDSRRDRSAKFPDQKNSDLPNGRLFHVGKNERCASSISFLCLHFRVPRSSSVFFPSCPLRPRPIPRQPRTYRSCSGWQSRSTPYSLRRSSLASRRVPWPVGVFSHQCVGRSCLRCALAHELLPVQPWSAAGSHRAPSRQVPQKDGTYTSLPVLTYQHARSDYES